MNTLGLDIGGANLKAATADGTARSERFPLWKHPDQLTDRLTDLVSQFTGIDRFAVTMTGELCDCFATKREGVNHILDAVEAVANDREVIVWLTNGRFRSIAEARREPLLTAASNWLALATFAGQLIPEGDALLVDVGSTTTDLIKLHDGVPIPAGRTDFDRLREGELLYTGVRRTPICALSLWRSVCAELFATTHDAYLWLGLTPEDPTDHDTADGRPATAEFARSRLARMIGADSDSFSPNDATAFAHEIVEVQTIALAVLMRKHSQELASMRKLILSGSGDYLARSAIEHLRTEAEPLEVISLNETWGKPASIAACAYALAQLATEG